MAYGKKSKIVSIALTPDELMFIQSYAKSVGANQSTVLRSAVVQFINRQNRKTEEARDVQIIEQLATLRAAIVIALRDLSFITAQNLHLTSTIFTDALPKEMCGLPDGDWEKLWDESAVWASKYLKVLETRLKPEP